MRTVFVGLFVAGILSGCASMSREECVTADWRAIGYEDGAAGLPVSAVSGRRAICAKKAKVTVDMAAYMAGRDRGLDVYCEPGNGYAVGSRGGAYNGVCAGALEDRFLAAYETGRRLFDLQAAVSSINGQIRQAHYDLRSVEHRMAETEVSIISPGFSAQERITMLAELKQLAEDKGAIEASLDALNREHALASQALDAFRDDLAFHGGWRGVAEPVDASF
ncbi:MAG: DUF2799 domain-containing protein [Pseudomonadota bacterium]